MLDLTFMAEVYWDLEWTMQQQGFDDVRTATTADNGCLLRAVNMYGMSWMGDWT